MAHSARTRALRCTAPAAVVAVALAGCATTQQEAARLQLNAARIRASEQPTQVTAPGQAVDVTRVARVVTSSGSAFVVQLRNVGRKPVSDLPISVGVRVGRGRPIYLNRQSPTEFSYFDAHLPLISAGGSLTWVYTTGRHLPRHARPFAVVGATPSTTAPQANPLPVIRAAATDLTASATSTGGVALAVSVRNLSSVPQYQLQVYAFAQRAGRYVAAGNLTVAHLGSGATSRLKLRILGHFDHARLQVEAPPTIFQ